MTIDARKLEQELIDEIKGPTRQVISDIGYTNPRYGYLGRGDGTVTAVNPNRLWNREMYYYTMEGSRKSQYSSGILDKGAGILFADVTEQIDLPIWLAAPPGSQQMHIIAPANAQAFNAFLGLTPMDIRVGLGGFRAVTGVATLGYERFVTVTCAGAGYNITLPTAKFREYWIMRIDATGTAVSLVPASGLINGAASITVNTQWVGKQCICNGTDYFAY